MSCQTPIIASENHMNRTVFVTSSLLALFLAACGSNPAAQIPQGPSAALTSNLTQQQAIARKSELQSGLKTVASSIASGGNLRAASVSSLVPPAAQASLPAAVANLRPFASGGLKAQAVFNGTYNCKVSGTITYSGDNADADADGLVKAGFAQFNNCNEDGKDTLNGQIVVQDDNDADAKSGYLAFFDARVTGTKNEQLTFGVDFSPKTAGAYDLKFGFKAVGSNGDYLDFGYNLNYVATDASKPFQAGTLNFTGKFGVKSGTDEFVFGLEGVNLQYDKACQDFTGGTGTYKDSQNNKLEVIYSGCVTPKTKHNGTDI